MKKTNLDKIKNIACLMLHVDPVPDDKFFGLIMHHPFFNSNVLPDIDDDGKIEGMFNYYDDQKDGGHKYKRYINKIEQEILNAKNYSTIFCYLNSPYQMNFLRLTYSYFSLPDLADALKHCWVSQEFPNYTERGHSLRRVVKMFKMTKDYIMSDEDKAVLDSLPDIVTVYRGQSYHSKFYPALSWTLDKDKATWFMNRFTYNGGVLYEAKIPKEHILAYFSDTGESEIIVNYTQLREIKKIDEIYATNKKN